MAYRVIWNMLIFDYFDRRIRYVLPSCVVMVFINAIIPNPHGAPYQEFAPLAPVTERVSLEVWTII